MTGKDKCEFLREIRKNMAEANGIPYEPRECNYEGDCSGTCPFCEREAADLMTKLREKEARGEKIEIDEACTTIFDREKMKALKMEAEEYITPVGKIRCDDDYNIKLRNLEIEEKERIIRDQMTPLMGDVNFYEDLRKAGNENMIQIEEEEHNRQMEALERRKKSLANKVLLRIRNLIDSPLKGAIEFDK